MATPAPGPPTDYTRRVRRKSPIRRHSIPNRTKSYTSTHLQWPLPNKCSTQHDFTRTSNDRQCHLTFHWTTPPTITQHCTPPSSTTPTKWFSHWYQSTPTITTTTELVSQPQSTRLVVPTTRGQRQWMVRMEQRRQTAAARGTPRNWRSSHRVMTSQWFVARYLAYLGHGIYSLLSACLRGSTGELSVNTPRASRLEQSIQSPPVVYV